MEGTVCPVKEQNRHLDGSQEKVYSLSGTIQRVNYKTGEMVVVAQGKIVRFDVLEDCQLRFNGEPAILRCFHPLDPVQVIFSEQVPPWRARSLASWEAA